MISHETDWMIWVETMCKAEGYPTIAPERYHASAALRDRIERIMDQPDGWLIVLKPREQR